MGDGCDLDSLDEHRPNKKTNWVFFSMAAFLQKSLKYQANVFC